MAIDGEGAGGGAATGSAADLTGAGADGGAGEGSSGAAGGDGGAEGDGQQMTGGADPDWYGQLPVEAEEGGTSLRDWVKAAGVKDVSGLAKIARDNLQAVRSSGRVAVPGEGAKPEEVRAYHTAIGVPETAEGYAIVAPEGPDGKPLPLDTELIGQLAASALKGGTPKAAFEGLVGDFIKIQLDQAAAAEAKQKSDAAAVVKSWGADADAKLSAVTSAAKVLGLSSSELLAMRASLGAEKTLNMLARIGGGMSEDVLVGGGKNSFGISAAQAKIEMQEVKADKAFMAKIHIKGSPERARWNRLQDAIGEEADRQAAA
jgi:hypothetical protein